MLQIQDIINSFARYKRDIDDVDADVILEWAQFTTNFIYDKVRKIDAGRFVKSQSYSVVLPPQTESLPSDFQDMNQTQCGLFKYVSRKRSVITFDQGDDFGITFSNSGGASSYNESIRVQGGSSRGFTGDSAATLLLSFDTPINWNEFDDGGAQSPSNDFISIWAYAGNSIPTSATIEFSTSNAGADVGVNQFSYQKTGLVAGWNRIKVAKSAFTTTGSPDWSNLGYLRLIYAGGSSSTNFYWDKMELVESEVNGKGQTDYRLPITGYGSRKLGYYLEGSTIVFTDYGNEPGNTSVPTIVDKEYVMKYLPNAPLFSSADDYITVDGTANTAQIVEDQHLEYMVKAMDVLYGQWDNDPMSESLADQRFVRALGGVLDGYNRTPQISVMKNPSRFF